MVMQLVKKLEFRIYVFSASYLDRYVVRWTVWTTINIEDIEMKYEINEDLVVKYKNPWVIQGQF